MLSPYINIEIINVFLRRFAQEIPPGVQAVMIWDQAGFHTGKDIEVPANVTILRLPPYSPELNPMENLWHYLRSHYWSNRAFANYDALLDAAERAWRHSACNPTIIQTVCHAPYAEAQ